VNPPPYLASECYRGQHNDCHPFDDGRPDCDCWCHHGWELDDEADWPDDVVVDRPVETIEIPGVSR
jgi:hypothetical protein